MKKKLLAVMMMLTMVSASACGKTEEAASTQVAETDILQEQRTEEAATQSETAAATAQEKTVEGMVTEAAANHMTLLTPNGEFLFLAYSETGVETGLEDGVLLGSIMSVTYTGSSDTGDAMVVKVAEGTIQTEISREAFEFAITAVDAIKFMDQEGFADMLSYPVYLEPKDDVSVTVKNREGFLAIEKENIFTEEMMTLGDFNFFEMAYSKAGYIVGNSMPNFIFQENAEGFSITGVNGTVDEVQETDGSTDGSTE